MLTADTSLSIHQVGQFIYPSHRFCFLNYEPHHNKKTLCLSNKKFTSLYIETVIDYNKIDFYVLWIGKQIIVVELYFIDQSMKCKIVSREIVACHGLNNKKLNGVIFYLS